MVKRLLIGLLLCLPPPLSAAGLADWLAVNNPRVIDYLQALHAGDVGRILDGVALSDGGRALAGLRYRGRVSGVHPGTWIHLLEGERGMVAYLWLEPGAAPLALPGCPGPRPPDWWPGREAAVLSGDVYTFRQLTAEAGVVTTHCVPPAWRSAAGGEGRATDAR